MGKKGLKSCKGRGESWDEPKTERVNVQVTKTCKTLLQKQSKEKNISIAELMERFSRGQLGEQALVDALISRPLDAHQVKSAIASFSRREWINIARLCLELLNVDEGKLEMASKGGDIKETIAELVQVNRAACIEAFEDIVPIERVDAIIGGDRPTDDELSLLSAALSRGLGVLQQLRTREFGNGNSHQGNKSSL
jgi:hypothetical protein